MNADLKWGDLELLDRILHGGTLSGGARLLRIDQTTVARRLAALERRIGLSLFDRIDGRLVATPALRQVTDRLRTISEEAELARAVLARTGTALQGNVRITSVGFVLSRILTPALAGFARHHPGITLDFIAEDQALSFDRREADIAIRFGREAEDRTRIKSLGAIRFGLYRPADLTAESAVPVVKYGEELSHVPEMRALDRVRPGAHVVFRANRLDILIEAALAFGAEIMLPEVLARTDARFAAASGPDSWTERSCYLMLHPERVRVPSVAMAARWAETAIRSWR